MTEAFDVGSGESTKIDGITVIPRPSRNQLEERALEDYGEHRARLINWMLHLGKDPEKGVGYVNYTTRDRASRLDQFYRWVWDEEGYYTITQTPT